MKPIRLCVIGAGIIWHDFHKESLERLSEYFEIAAFCARSPETLERAREGFPEAAGYRDVDKALADSRVDAALVLTPIPLNATMAIRALEADKDVFLEKPVAMSESECIRLEQAVARSGRTVYVLENQAYDSRIVAAASAVSDGVIGRPVAFEAVTHFFFGGERSQVGAYAETSWRAQPEFPLGIVFDGGVHDLAGFRMLFGGPWAVYARGYSMREGYGEFDLVRMTLLYGTPGDQLEGHFSHGVCFPGGDNHLTIRGSEGILRIAAGDVVAVDSDGDHELLEVADGESHALMWDALAEAVAAGQEPAYTLSDALGEVRTLLAADRSIRAGRVEPV